MRLYTIGHSVRTADDFLGLLKFGAIKTLADVRAVPASRRQPQFNAAVLEQALAAAGIAYVPMTELGGRRPAQKNSANIGLGEGLRGYADYMQTKAFSMPLDRLLQIAAAAPTAMMCAEADPLNCHRQLIADAALGRGWQVRHIIMVKENAGLAPHHLTRGAVVNNGRISYPPAQKALPL